MDTLREQGIQFVSSVQSKAARGAPVGAGAAESGTEDVEEMQRRKARGQTYPVPPGVRRSWWIPGVVNGRK